jgi:hypothetical protein
VDEFQSLATSNFIPMLSESRKYGLSLVLANQFVSQITDDRIMNGIFGNVGTHVCFRVGRDDAEKLEPQFGPSFDRADLANLPNWHACVRTTVDGRVTAPFTLRTNPLSPTESDPERVAKMVDAAKAACTRPRAEVEQEILASTARLGPMPDDSEKPVQLIIVEKDPVVLGRLLVAAKEGYCMTTNDLRDLPSCRRNFPGLPVLILANKQFLPESKELFMKSLLAEYTTTVLFYNPLPAADEKLAGEAVQQKRVYLASGHSVDDLEARSADKSPPGWIRRLYLEVQAANTDLPTTTNSA